MALQDNTENFITGNITGDGYILLPDGYTGGGSGGSGGGSYNVTFTRGCTNPNADNYNPLATVDDGTCILRENGYSPVEVNNIVNILFTSNPSNASILIDDVETGYNCTTTLSFNAKEFLTAKIFKVKQTDMILSEQYQVRSYRATDVSGITIYPIKVSKLIDGVWNEISTTSTSNILTNISLQFNLTSKSEYIGEVTPTNYQVEIFGTVSNEGVVKYTTSDGVTGFVTNSSSLLLNITTNNTSGVPYIKFEKFGDDKSTYRSSYVVVAPGIDKGIRIDDDFKKELTAGITKIYVTVDRLEPDLNLPTVSVDIDSLEFNIAGENPVSLTYTSTDSNSVLYSLGSVQRTLDPNGILTFKSSDFSNGVGQYTVYLQAVSPTKKSELKQVHINVVSKTYLPGPDITKINYPYNIKGADFRGYDEDFQISWQSINTNYIKIYVTKVSDSFLVSHEAANGARILNVEDILIKANETFNDSTDILTFDLILVPYNIEGDEIVHGKEEKITIIFDKGDLKLKRAQVITDLKIAFQQELNTKVFDAETSKYLTHYVHFGDGDDKLISSWGIDKDTFSTWVENEETSIRTQTNEVRTLVLKLYEPLPNSFQPNQQLWISKIQSLPVLDQVVITNEVVESCTRLSPNFNLEIGDDIGYQILDELVASGSTSSTELIESYIGTNEFSLSSLNINYLSDSEYNWVEFVKYSSATERVENFFYKIQLIELYNNTLESLQSSSIATTGSLSVTNEISRVNEKISTVIRGFDTFEKTLYIESGSLTYPGAGQGSISGSTDIDVQNWYINIIGSAKEYDKYNKNILVNNIPKHIINDEQGQDFILFFNMIGQHFDVIWSYIKGVAKSKQLTNTYEDGMASDLIYHMLESLGWDADMGVKSQYLWEYAFGINKDGSSASAMTGKDRQQEIWRRLLNNLPYLYKHKGTKRALTAAMSCYGIPTSMLTIMEFGGPVDPTESGVTAFTFDDRTAALKFNDDSRIDIPWNRCVSTNEYPQSIELRINTEFKRDHTLISTQGWELNLLQGTGSLGALEFKTLVGTSTTDFFPIFDDEYTQVVINRSLVGDNEVYDIYGKEGFNERIRNEGYTQLLVPTGSSIWNYPTDLDLGSGFSGSMDEFRLWTAPLDESRIVNHTLLPDAIDGNHVSSSTEDLVLRLDFEYPKDRNLDPMIKNVSINRTYGADYVTGSLFDSIPEYPYNYVTYERSVTAMVPSMGVGYGNKVRFESQTLNNYLHFGTTSNVSTLQKSNDSSKLGLFFSPMREINMDILRSLGQFNIDNYIGDPSDEYSDKYKNLDELRNYYFQRYNLNIYEYIQLVRYIDQTLFTTLESLVPGRSKVSSGLLIEPHLLERSKYAHTKPIGEELSKTTSIVISDYINEESTFENKSAEIDTSEEISLSGINTQFETTIDTETDLPLYATPSFYNSEIPNTGDSITFEGVNSLVSIDINTKEEDNIVGEYESIQFQQIGMDVDSIDVTGFGLWGSNGNTIRTYIDKDNNRIQERKKVYRIQESSVVNIPENINPSDSSLGMNYVPTTFYKYKVTFLDFDQTAPIVNGNITEVIPLNGYFPSHFRYTGDVTTGLEYSYSRGSKQTSATTLDGGPAVETFTTNPNILKVNDIGRGSGEPILEVD